MTCTPTGWNGLDLLWLAETRRKLNRLMVSRNGAVQSIAQHQQRTTEAKTAEGHILEAQEHLQGIAKTIQQQAHKQMASVVSRCLSAVFEDPYELRIEFVERRGRTEAEFVYLRNGKKCSPRVTSGGVREVTSLALRLAKLVMALPPARRLLILDEPFGGLSGENLQRVAALIESLAADLQVQFILVSHDPALQLGQVIQL